MTANPFDEIIDRHNTNSVKYDFAAEYGHAADELPLWVADMDFRAPEPVLAALRKAVDHGIFGYSDAKGSYFSAIQKWFAKYYRWDVREEWLVRTPGVVFAVSMAVRALTEPGDSVLIQPPVYYPFYRVIGKNGRKLVESPLICRDGRYSIDFEDFEKKIESCGVKLFILCSPHNPVCRVWTTEELQRIGSICRKHHVYVVSDEIHCDFTLPGHRHHVFPEAVPELAPQTIVCTAPSKTFNLAGLQVSNIFIPDETTRTAFRREMDRAGYSELNLMGLIACQAAYEHGEGWLTACRAYLLENLNYVRGFLRERIPQIRLVEPEGTYFAWMDCSALGLSTEELNAWVKDKAKLWLDAGSIFGSMSGQYQRMILACPRSMLRRAMEQLEEAVKELRQ